MIRTSRTRNRSCVRHSSARARGADACERGQRSLDLFHDTQSNRQRFAAVVTRHGHPLLPSHRRDEALDLEAQRLTVWGFERNALDEGFEREWALRERRQIEVAAQSVELTVACGEVEGELSALLEDAN